MGSHLNYKLYLFNKKECIEENKGERAGLFNDMIEMSRHFPEIIFVVNCVIVENSNDNWKDYYKNGKHIKCRGMGRCYNPFDKMLISSED